MIPIQKICPSCKIKLQTDFTRHFCSKEIVACGNCHSEFVMVTKIYKTIIPLLAIGVAYAIASFFEIAHTLENLGKIKFSILFALLFAFIDFLMSNLVAVPETFLNRSSARRKLSLYWPFFALLLILPINNRIFLAPFLLPMIFISFYDYIADARSRKVKY